MINELAAETAQVIASFTGAASHDYALILGSGRGGTTDLIGETAAEVPTEKVPGFSANDVVGYHGTLRPIVPESDRALVLGARTHFYEGKGVDAVAHGVRAAAATGVKMCILTNGYGSTVPEWDSGTAALISDHISFTVMSPPWGVNSVDLIDLYSPRSREVTRGVDPGLPEGVYVQSSGPHYGTPTEMCMAKALDADLVGMLTAFETIAARATGMEVLGIFLMTNYAVGTASGVSSHGEVFEAGKVTDLYISRLLADTVRIINRAGSGVARPLTDAD